MMKAFLPHILQRLRVLFRYRVSDVDMEHAVRKRDDMFR